MSVALVRGLEREEAPDIHHEPAEDLVADVEVVVRVAGPLPADDPVVGIVGRIRRETDAELKALFQALEKEVDPRTGAAAPSKPRTAGRGLPFSASWFSTPPRTDRAALILTTNLPSPSGPRSFRTRGSAKPVLGRITNRAHIIDTGQESYRCRRTSEKRQKKG